MSIWFLTGVAKAASTTKSISHWGPCGTSGAHTTVGVAVDVPASTWPGSLIASAYLARDITV